MSKKARSSKVAGLCGFQCRSFAIVVHCNPHDHRTAMLNTKLEDLRETRTRRSELATI